MMKKMKIEKQLIFADHVKRLLSLHVQENLTYRHEEEGIRAIGPLYINGEYEGNDGVETFRETLEMDVLAPNDKLSKEPFRLQIAEYQGKEQDDSIQVMIHLDIHGLKADQDETRTSDSKDSDHSSLYANNKQTTAEKRNTDNVEQNTSTDEQTSETQAQSENEAPAIDSFDDLFADAQSTYTSYRIVVAKANDTYTAIANRYDVNEDALRETNKNKEILPKTLVILPFVQS